MQGIELITQERVEQVLKHKFNAKYDAQHDTEELKKVAVYVLTKEIRFFPEDWDDKWFVKLEKKEGIEALKVAGALIAAEIDRLLNKE